MSEISQLAMAAKAWPFEQARLLIERMAKHPKDVVTFQTGYGPSGLPHIGTFGEVARTTMVRHAFEVLTEGKVKTRLICVSDDMDGMRKIPDTVPNPKALEPYMQMPMTSVPDPFGTHESFGANMNARLCAFLDRFGFDYEFASATKLYKSGVYDAMLLRALERYDQIQAVMLPTLGPERRATYSPFLPISPTSGRVLYVPMKAIDAKAGTVTFEDEDGRDATLPVTGGHVKLQWKPDFGMRWAALGVDFEMMGKDHQPNQGVYARICKILGAEPPVNYVFELFLDEKGEKISKTKGNGISFDDWLRYAPTESAALYQFQKPRTAKRLYFDVIPKAVDEYLSFLDAYQTQNEAQRLENPVWHIHNGNPPAPEGMATFAPGRNSAATASISFALLLNLVSAANAETKEQLWKFIGKYAPGMSPETHPRLDRLCGYAIAYYEDFVKPAKRFRPPTDIERVAFQDLLARLRTLPDGADAEIIQNEIYEVGKTHAFESLRAWFTALYQVLLGEDSGPRFGSFVAIFGVSETIALIERGLEGALAPQA